MKSIEQFRAEQAEAMEKSLKAHALMLERAGHFGSLGFPVPEYFSDTRLYGAVCATYRNGNATKPDSLRSMSEAVEMFRKFVDAETVLPFHILQDGYSTFMHPESKMPAKKQESAHPYKRDMYRTGGYAALLGVKHMGEQGHTSAELEFFATLGGLLFRISIDFGRGYIGQCPSLAPRAVVKRGYGGRIESRSYESHPDARALSDAFISYSYGGDSGPIKTGADHRFLFVSDHDGDEVSPCSHALAQLEILADIVDGVKKGE